MPVRSTLSLGARVIEKHFTLDKNYSSFRDHSLSAEPEELAELVRFSKSVDVSLGRTKSPFQVTRRTLRQV